MSNNFIYHKELLGRDEVDLNNSLIAGALGNKCVLVTGAGGSIGSELVKQCLSYKPSKLICVDYSEEKIFNLYQKYDDSILKPILADITNLNELEKVYFRYKPEIVFHAAAYKHVPIQEIFPWNAVKTNIGGTKNNILLSHKYLVKKFVLVSTDKAVNPVSIMGATKRIAEKIILNFDLKSKTSFKAVRFGNVLGSSGSVLPIFQNQINKGGPITITHPKMSRYFMSIEEASNLILQCCSLGKNR
jgi:FlaA1/EpsC-like NDP-sugar epimerase